MPRIPSDSVAILDANSAPFISSCHGWIKTGRPVSSLRSALRIADGSCCGSTADRTTIHVLSHGDCKIGRNIWGNDRQPEDLDMKRFACRSHGFEILSAVPSQTKVEPVSGDRLLNGVAMAIELIADCRPDEVRAVRVEALLHQKVIANGESARSFDVSVNDRRCSSAAVSSPSAS